MALENRETHQQGIIGRNLRNLRESRGFTQQALGDLLGVTFQQIQKYEKGSSGVPATRLFELSRILHVPCEYFFEGLEDPHSAIAPPTAIHPAILVRALKIQKGCPPPERIKILKIIDVFTG